MKKLKLSFTTYKGLAMGFVWVDNHFEKGMCFILPFFSIDFMKKKR